MGGSIKALFRLPFNVRQEGVWFYSCCPVLDVSSQGHTHDEAISNLIEALQLYIESCFRRGTLDEVLRESGFEFDESHDEEEEGEYVDVPISLVARGHAEARAR